MGPRSIHTFQPYMPFQVPPIYSLQKSGKCVLDNVEYLIVSNIYGRICVHTLSHDASTILDWLEYWYSLGM